MNLEWNKCGTDWCDFFAVDLADSHFDNLEGVYIIWSSSGLAEYVGQGKIRDQIQVHRNQKVFLDLKKEVLYVTWAQLNKIHRDNVERFLANTLSPCISSFHPKAVPLVVNLPGE